MIPHHLIHQHHEAVVDAIHQAALLHLDSLARFGQYSMARRKTLLEAEALHASEAEGRTPLQRVSTVSADEFRFAMSLAGESYVGWTELCERQWRALHDRVQATVAYYADHAPGEFALALKLAQRTNDLATDSAERVAEDSKAAVVEAVDEIVGALDAGAPADKPNRRSRKAA